MRTNLTWQLPHHQPKGAIALWAVIPISKETQMSSQDTTGKAQFVVVQFLLMNSVDGQNPLEALTKRLDSIVSVAGNGKCPGSPVMGFKLVGNADVDEETASALADQSFKHRYVFDGEKDSAHYLMVMEGDVSPTLHGPYETEAKRLIAAQTYRVDEGDDDGLYRLNVPKGTNLYVGEFSGAEVNGD